ncbi:hypothetical protein ILUMI_24413, partial [Ignelater luminosus]
KRPRGFDYSESEVSRPQAQLVGGHLEATTYRPPHFSRQFAQQPFLAQRRTEASGIINPSVNQHELVNRDLYNRALINTNQNLIINQQPQVYHQQNSQQQQFIYTPFDQQQQQTYNNQPFLQQQQLLNQQRLIQQQQLLAQQNQHLSPQQRIDNSQNQQYVARAYFPVNFHQNQQQQEQQRLREQQIYNQILQNQRYQQEQQLRAQLNRSYNRFDLSGSSSNNRFASLG